MRVCFCIIIRNFLIEFLLVFDSLNESQRKAIFHKKKYFFFFLFVHLKLLKLINFWLLFLSLFFISIFYLYRFRNRNRMDSWLIIFIIIILQLQVDNCVNNIFLLHRNRKVYEEMLEVIQQHPLHLGENYLLKCKSIWNIEGEKGVFILLNLIVNFLHF